MTEPTGVHAEIWELLLENFVGVENKTKREAIIQRFNLIRKKDLGDRFFRKVVSDLVTEYKKAICTMSDGGYYVARTGSESRRRGDRAGEQGRGVLRPRTATKTVRSDRPAGEFVLMQTTNGAGQIWYYLRKV